MNTIRVIRTSSREKDDLLTGRLPELRALGLHTRYDDLPSDRGWPYAAASISDRADALNRALREPDTDAVLCARGGYGASDLLPRLDYSGLMHVPPKLVIGFSDVSAIHSALYTRLGWPGLHAPMPATVLWGKNGEERDLEALRAVIAGFAWQNKIEGAIPVRPLTPGAEVEGRLFGGCFTVLTNLIGTAYLPKSLAGMILFIEDTDENPPRLVRALNQWLQAGLLQGVKAVVIGHLRNLGEKIVDCAPFVYEQLASRLTAAIPVFSTDAFGHTCPNFPLLIGAEARLSGDCLSWVYTPSRRPSLLNT